MPQFVVRPSRDVRFKEFGRERRMAGLGAKPKVRFLTSNQLAPLEEISATASSAAAIVDAYASESASQDTIKIFGVFTPMRSSRIVQAEI